MRNERICIMVDSGCDVPEELRKQYDMRVLPLKILYPEGEYLDRVTISAQEVYDRMEEVLPKTSLPDGASIEAALDQAKADGFTHVLVVCISSGLSGTYNMIRLVCQDYEGLTPHVFDTKNISFGSGIFAVMAAKWVAAGCPWEELKERLELRRWDSKVFFCLDTLEYLRKGGRIGLVSAVVGTALKLKPIISCNKEGVYYTASKALGRKRSLDRMLEMATEFARKGKNSVISMLNGKAEQEAAEMLPRLLAAMGCDRLLAEGQISPALVVHTGPGLLGIHVLKDGMG